MSGRRGREGFSLVELMAALVAGLVAISAIYAVSSGSARHFHEQQRIAQTQMSLRMATTQLRADIARAGLFGTPNADASTTSNTAGCPSPADKVVSIEHLDDQDSAAFPEYADNGIQFDRIRLVGNYATTGAYMIAGAASATSVRLQTTWQSFRRDFVDPSSGTVDQDAFKAAFRAGRYLHVRTLQDTSVFSPIAAPIYSDDTDLRVNVQTPMPITSACMPGLGDGATVAPLSRIEYAVVDPRVAASELGALDSAMDTTLENQLGLRPAVLVRREVPFNCTGASCTPIAGTTRVVLEYVADFDLSFVMDTQTDPTQPPTLVVTNSATTVNANPERVRSVIVTLSARTPGVVPQFAFANRDGGPLTRFRPLAGGSVEGAARVRTVQTEIFLPNLVPSPM